MAEPTIPTELWMFWATSYGSSRWLVSIDECSGADDLYLVTFSEETAKRVAKEQAEAYFDGKEANVIPVRIKPAPGPATKAMLEYLRQHMTDLQELDLSVDPDTPYLRVVKPFLAEWPEPTTPSTCAIDLIPGAITIEEADEPEQSPWKCALCGRPVRITDDLRPYHADGPANHDAELSDEDRKILADGLGLTD